MRSAGAAARARRALNRFAPYLPRQPELAEQTRPFLEALEHAKAVSVHGWARRRQPALQALPQGPGHLVSRSGVSVVLCGPERELRRRLRRVPSLEARVGRIRRFRPLSEAEWHRQSENPVEARWLSGV